jgi:hypothetical protein
MIFNVKVVDITPRQARSTVTSIKRFSRNIKKCFTGFLMLAIGEVFPSSLNVYLPLLSLCCLSDLLKGVKVTGFICAYPVF